MLTALQQFLPGQHVVQLLRVHHFLLCTKRTLSNIARRYFLSSGDILFWRALFLVRFLSPSSRQGSSQAWIFLMQQYVCVSLLSMKSSETFGVTGFALTYPFQSAVSVYICLFSVDLAKDKELLCRIWRTSSLLTPPAADICCHAITHWSEQRYGHPLYKHTSTSIELVCWYGSNSKWLRSPAQSSPHSFAVTELEYVMELLSDSTVMLLLRYST